MERKRGFVYCEQQMRGSKWMSFETSEITRVLKLFIPTHRSSAAEELALQRRPPITTKGVYKPQTLANVHDVKLMSIK